MIGVDLIGDIRRAYFEQRRPIKEIVRTFSVSRATVRRVIRSQKTEFRYERGVQPVPKLGEWVAVLSGILEREALDCCDREAISWIATTGGIGGGDIRDLMVQSVERRFGSVDRLPMPIEWLSDNGSPYVATDTRALARLIGLIPRTTPIESPQSNGMAEAFVKTFKRDYARVRARPDAAAVMHQLDGWFEHYNTVHPHKALGYRSPREFRALLKNGATVSAVGAWRRPHHSEPSADGIGSSPPAARSAETRSVWLDASAAVDPP